MAHHGHPWDECPSSEHLIRAPCKRPRAHTASWNRMPRWNEGWREHQRSASWVQISHYLPHKPSWCEAKVRQADGDSWKQRPRHPIGKWPAFDQACHFCQEGDPHDQTMATSWSLQPRLQIWLTDFLSSSLPLSGYSTENKTGGNLYFVVVSASQYEVTPIERSAVFVFSFRDFYFFIFFYHIFPSFIA